MDSAHIFSITVHFRIVHRDVARAGYYQVYSGCVVAVFVFSGIAEQTLCGNKKHKTATVYYLGLFCIYANSLLI